MDHRHSSMLIPAAVLLLLVIFTPLSLQNDRTYHDCYGTENSTTTSSAFTTNLNTLLSNLTSQLTTLNYYSTFYNASVGAPGPGAVFVFAQCISAGTAGDCRYCLRRSAPEILQLCPHSKKAFLLHTYCILRYSNDSSPFYNPVQGMNGLALYSSINSTDPWSFNTKMSNLMWKLSSMAASSTSKIALGFTKYDDYSRIYGMAQCIRDMSSNNCLLCLMRAMVVIPRHCDTSKGCTMYAPSCSFRYENYLFALAFNTSSNVIAFPPQPSSPPPLTQVFLPTGTSRTSNGR